MTRTQPESGPSSFTWTFYRELLVQLTDGRPARTFGEMADRVPDTPFLLLRHDVDLSPEAALRMAEVEAAAEIRSTYFVLSSAWGYNLLSPEHAGFPRALVDLGHEVGLHYDVVALERAAGGAPLEDVLAREIDTLGHLAGVEIRSIAMHNPSIMGDDPLRNTPFVNAYDPHLSKDIGYFSDSCGAWRDEFIARLDAGFPPRIQMLIHPIFWSETPRSRWETLDGYIALRKAALDEAAEVSREIWRNHEGVRQHDRR